MSSLCLIGHQIQQQIHAVWSRGKYTRDNHVDELQGFLDTSDEPLADHKADREIQFFFSNILFT